MGSLNRTLGVGQYATALPLFFNTKDLCNYTNFDTSFCKGFMAKITIELEERDFMELLSTLTEIKDTLVRVEELLATNHTVKNDS